MTSMSWIVSASFLCLVALDLHTTAALISLSAANDQLLTDPSSRFVRYFSSIVPDSNGPAAERSDYDQAPRRRDSIRQLTDDLMADILRRRNDVRNQRQYPALLEDDGLVDKQVLDAIRMVNRGRLFGSLPRSGIFETQATRRLSRRPTVDDRRPVFAKSDDRRELRSSRYANQMDEISQMLGKSSLYAPEDDDDDEENNNNEEEDEENENTDEGLGYPTRRLMLNQRLQKQQQQPRKGSPLNPLTRRPDSRLKGRPRFLSSLDKGKRPGGYSFNPLTRMISLT